MILRTIDLKQQGLVVSTLWRPLVKAVVELAPSIALTSDYIDNIGTWLYSETPIKSQNIGLAPIWALLRSYSPRLPSLSMPTLDVNIRGFRPKIIFTSAMDAPYVVIVTFERDAMQLLLHPNAPERSLLKFIGQLPADVELAVSYHDSDLADVKTITVKELIAELQGVVEQ